MAAVLDDWTTAPVDERVRATLGFLRKLTLEPAELGAADVEPLRAAGVDDDAIEDAVDVAVLFNLVDRIADAMAFTPPSAFLDGDLVRRGAEIMLERGYYPTPAPAGS